MLEEKLAAAGYIARRNELRALSWALGPRESAGASCLLLTGQPGVGKSALAGAVAVATDRQLVVHQCHAWTDADELFVGVDVAAAVAGDAAAVRQDGVLAVAARAAGRGAVVLLLDEIDKAPARAEALLLDWLQSGRVPVRPGFHLQTQLERVLVLVTSNGAREHSEALLRRCRRVRMVALPVATQERILCDRASAPSGVVRLAWREARRIAALDGCFQLSIQEGIHLLEEILDGTCEGVGDVRLALSGWAARGPAGEEAAGRSRLASAIWSEVLRAQARG